MNALTLAPIVAVLFALLARFGVVLPPTMTQPEVVAALLLVITAVTSIVRYRAGNGIETGWKAWWESRIIWTNIFGALFAIVALFGLSIGVNANDAVEFAMLGVGLVGWFLGRKPQAAIA